MLALLALALFQGFELAPPTPFDQAFALQIETGDPILDGHGPSKRVEYEAEYSGTLHLWTKADRDLDLFLRLEDTDGPLRVEDDNSGGGSTPYLRLDVEPGRRLVIRVALAHAGQEARDFSVEMHAVAAPETRATREAALAAREALTQIQALRAKPDLAAARALAGETIEELLGVDEARTSEAVASIAWKLANETHALSDLSLTRRAASWTWAHR